MIRLLFYPKVVPNRQMIAEVLLDPAQVLQSGMRRDDYLRLALDVLAPSFTELWGRETAGVVIPEVEAVCMPVRAAM